MYSKIKIAGHPVHPMLIPFPVAFYTATLAAFITYAVNADPFWFRVAYAANAAGVVMALVAAIPGFLDWALGIPSETHAKRDGLKHMGLNVTALALFAINLWLNSGQWNAVTPITRFAIILPLFGLISTIAAGYLGWTLVQKHHVGVQITPCPEVRYEERKKRAA